MRNRSPRECSTLHKEANRRHMESIRNTIYKLFYAGFKRQVIKKICSPDYSLNFLQNPI